MRSVMFITWSLRRTSGFSFAGTGTPRYQVGCFSSHSHCSESTPGMMGKKAYWFTIRGLREGGSNQRNALFGSSSKFLSSLNFSFRDSSKNIFPFCFSSILPNISGREEFVSWRFTHQTTPLCRTFPNFPLRKIALHMATTSNQVSELEDDSVGPVAIHPNRTGRAASLREHKCRKYRWCGALLVRGHHEYKFFWISGSLDASPYIAVVFRQPPICNIRSNFASLIVDRVLPE